MNIPKATAIPILEPIKTDSFKMDDEFFKKIKTPLIYGTFGIVLLALICIIIGLIYSKGGLSDSGQLTGEQHATTWIIIAFITAFLLIVLMVIPNYKELLIFLGKLKFVLLLVAYIIGLIILYRSVPSGIVNAYAFLFFPITMIIGIYLFYLAMEKGQLYGFDLNYERIKYALIFFCLIAFMLVFYTVDPGGYLKTYFGPSLLVTILLVVFGFLYLLTLMTLPSIKQGQGQGSSSGEQGGFFKGLSKTALFSGVAFIIFLIVVVSGILAYPGGFTKGTSVAGSDKTNTVSLIAILTIVVFVLWILFFGILSFSNIKLRDSDGDIDKSMSNISNIARQVFMLLFGLIFSGLIIYWLVTGVEGLSSKSGIISFILNALIIVTVLGLVFKLITGGTYYKKSALFRLVVNTLFYIPCVLVGIIDSIISIFGLGIPSAKTGESILSATKNTPYSYYILLFLIILLYAVYYFIAPQVQTNMAKQGGTILVNAPMYSNTENVIGTYDSLNGTNADTNPYDYQYAISFWVFIDAVSPNASSSLEKYTSLLNYGDKPNVLYNASENTLMITMLNTGEPAIGSVSRLKNPQELDANGNIIIYKMPNVLLQKWNNIIINYNGGTLDIFYNGKLVKSVNEVVPKMSKDVLTVGSNNGVNGGICNVNYFNTNLTASQVYYLYDTVKDKTPPVASSSRESIVKDVLAGVNIKSNPQVITIPITIDVKSQASSQEAVPDQPPAKPDPNKSFTDYLSFKWFAVANNDNFNGL